MKNVVRALALVICVSPTAAWAQAANDSTNVTVLSVYRETVKPGKGDAHDAHEVAWAGAFEAAKSETASLAITAMTGPAENWYISPFANWADFERDNKATETTPALSAIGKKYTPPEADYLNDGRRMILVAMPELSYGAGPDIASSRYFSITRISVRPGHIAEFEERSKATKAAHESAKLTDSYSIWRAAAGAPAGTYYQFVPRKSLAEIDAGGTVHGAAYQAALGGPEGQKKLDALTSSAIISSETDHFAFAPQQSVPRASWVTADPAYWTHKPVAVAKKPQ